MDGLWVERRKTMAYKEEMKEKKRKRKTMYREEQEMESIRKRTESDN